MKNLITLWKENRQEKEAQNKQDLKSRIVKNKEALLDVMSSNIRGARQCPHLLGQKCIGEMCQMFMEFRSVNAQTGEEFKFYQCVYVQTPLLLIEVIQEVVKLNQLLTKEEK